jgi:hypothetical protein
MLSSIRVIEDDRAAGARIDLGGVVCHQVTQDDPALRILRFQIPCRFDSDLMKIAVRPHYAVDADLVTRCAHSII